MRGTVFSENEEEPGGELVLFRDITYERKMARNTETLLRISTALPSHPDLEDLLDFISTEMKKILEVEGAMVILLDEEKKEFFFLGGAYEDGATRTRARQIRFPIDRGVAGKVAQDGSGGDRTGHLQGPGLLFRRGAQAWRAYQEHDGRPVAKR